MSDDLLPELASRPIAPTRVIPAQPPAIPQAVDRTPAPEPEAPPGNRLRTIRPGRPYWADHGPTPRASPEPGPTVLLDARTVTPDPAPEPERPKRDKTRGARRQRRLRAARTPKAAAPPLVEPDVDDDQDDQPEGEQQRRFTLRRLRPPTLDFRPSDQRQRDRLKNVGTLAAGAGIGWQCYLGPAYSEIIRTLGRVNPGWGVAAGIAMVVAGMVIDDGLRRGTRIGDVTALGLAFITVARIPLGTAIVALGLYAPGRI